MPSLNKFDITLVNKSEKPIATAEKAVYSLTKTKGEPFPRGATIVLYEVEMIEGDSLPEVFDLTAIKDDGVIQTKIRIMNCSIKAQIDEQLVAVSLAPDVGHE